MPWGAVTSGSGTERVAVLPGLRPTTARTLSEAFPGVAVTVGDQEVVVTVLEDSVAPPLVRETRYDVALVDGVPRRGDVVGAVRVGGDGSREAGGRRGWLAGLAGVVPTVPTATAAARAAAAMRNVRTANMVIPLDRK